MSGTWTSSTASSAAKPAEVQRIGFAELGLALRRGWQDFQAIPTQLVFLSVIYPIIGLFAATLAAGREVMHLVYPLAAGFALVGPVAALGTYEISRRREKGQPVSWVNAFDVLRSPAIGPICALGLLLLAILIAWVAAADAIHAATVGRLPAEMPWREALFGTPEGQRLIWLGNLVGFCFALLVLVLTALSFPMLLDRGGGVGRAIATSVRAFMVNPLPMLGWGLIVAVLLLLGSIPFFVGLAVVLPVLGHATWHLYRLVVA